VPELLVDGVQRRFDLDRGVVGIGGRRWIQLGERRRLARHAASLDEPGEGTAQQRLGRRDEQQAQRDEADDRAVAMRSPPTACRHRFSSHRSPITRVIYGPGGVPSVRAPRDEIRTPVAVFS